MNATETSEFRRLLEEERERVSDTLAVLYEDSLRTMGDEVGLPGGVGADTATVTFDRELGTGLVEGAQQTLAQIDRALERLDGGTYGTCERCGESIGRERLRARPAATLCIDDQRAADRA